MYDAIAPCLYAFRPSSVCAAQFPDFVFLSHTLLSSFFHSLSSGLVLNFSPSLSTQPLVFSLLISIPPESPVSLYHLFNYAAYGNPSQRLQVAQRAEKFSLTISLRIFYFISLLRCKLRHNPQPCTYSEEQHRGTACNQLSQIWPSLSLAPNS